MRLLLAILLSVPLAAQDTSPAPAQQQEAKSPAQDASTPAAQQQQEAKSPAPAATEQWLSGNIEFGYRWTSGVAGSLDTYRSMVNLGEGPKLINLDLSLKDPSRRLFDKMTLRANSWGGDPYNTAHMDVQRERAYNLSVDYRNLIYFSDVPSFGNPLIDQGVLTSQKSYDLHRRLLDAELDLLPGRRVVPYLAFTRDWGEGNGITDFEVDSNEYPVANILRDTTEQYRGGLRIELRRFHVTLEQGGTTFKDDQRVYASGQNFGNRTTPLFGQTLVLSSLNQAYGIRGDSIYSKGLLTANPFSWLDVYGQFLYSRPRSDVNYSQINTGLFADLASLAFFSAQNTLVASQAEQPHSSGSFGLEVRPLHRVRVLESLTTDHFQITSASLQNDVFFGVTPASVSLSGTESTPNVTPVVMNYNRQEVDVLLDVTKKVTLRVGHRYEWGDAQARASQLSQVGPLDAGQLRMQVGLAGVTYRPVEKLSLHLDFENSGSARTYFRTSLSDYQKGRVRARYQVLGSLAISADLSVLNNQNPVPGIRYDFLSRDSTASVFWTPKGGKRISLLGDYTRSTLRSDLSYLVPQTLQPARSFYRENAHTATGLLEVNLLSTKQGPAKFSAGGSFFSSSGSRPTQFYQPIGRFSFPLHKKLAWFGEWRWYNLAEPFYLFEGFRTHTVVFGLRAAL